jgi:glycosyltransferase involved in cell wall biosynthesis
MSLMDIKQPYRVTIGMPVYNGARTLRTVLDSIVAQSYSNFKIVISDNASTDATESICREFAGKDERMSYIRQSSNIGADANFSFVLSLADTEYFIWAAADDIRSSNFVEENLRFLDSHPDFVGSTCRVRFEGCAYDPVKMGDETRDEPDHLDRILNFFGDWHANGRFYSLFRTGAVRNAQLSGSAFFGEDWVFVIRLLQQGKLKRLDCGSVDLGRNGVSNSSEVFSRFRTRAICWLIPFFDLSLTASSLFRKATFSQKRKLFVHLLRLNYWAFRLQIKTELKRTYTRLRGTRRFSASLDQAR